MIFNIRKHMKFLTKVFPFILLVKNFSLNCEIFNKRFFKAILELNDRKIKKCLSKLIKKSFIIDYFTHKQKFSIENRNKSTQTSNAIKWRLLWSLRICFG